MIVNVLEPVQDVSGYIRNPKLTISIGGGNNFIQCHCAFFNDNIERVPILEGLMNIRYLWVPKLLQTLKFVPPFFTHSFVTAILRKYHLSYQIVPPLVRTIVDCTKRALTYLMAYKVVNPVYFYSLARTWRYKNAR